MQHPLILPLFLISRAERGIISHCQRNKVQIPSKGPSWACPSLPFSHLSLSSYMGPFSPRPLLRVFCFSPHLANTYSTCRAQLGCRLLWHTLLDSCPHLMSSRLEACCAIRCATVLCANYSPLSLFQCPSLVLVSF